MSSTARRLGLALGLLLGWAACSSIASTPQNPALPWRAETAAQSLLAWVPLGADLVIEVDLARLRANPALAPLLGRLKPPASIADGDLLARADAAVLCVYDVGDAAKQLILLRSQSEELPGASPLAPGVFSLGDPGLVRRSEAVASPSDSVLGGHRFSLLRAGPMPEKAEAAIVRIVAQLDFDARVALASKVSMSDVPVTVSLWGDVVDDLAIVVHLQAEEADRAPRLEKALRALRAKLSAERYLRYLGLAPAIRRARVTRSGTGLQVVFLLGPKRLAFVVERLVRQLTKAQP